MTDAELEAMECDARDFICPDVPARLLADHVHALIAEVRRLRSLPAQEAQRAAELRSGCEVLTHTNPPVVFLGG